MVTKPLATAIANICARNKGLSKIVLPRALPMRFKRALCAAFAAQGGHPAPIGSGPGELAIGEAIALRTPEGTGGTRAVMLVAVEGDAQELKSLETFRDVLVGGLPGGLIAGEQAILRSEAIAAEIADLLARTPEGRGLDTEKFRISLHSAFSYLARAYQEAGNAETRWTSAVWLHLDMLVDRLKEGLGSFPSDAPFWERDVVYACAGLPRPTGPGSFSPANKPGNYVKVVEQDWSDREQIELSLIRIHEIDGGDDSHHALADLDWSGIVSSRTSLGHPLLALAFHEADRGRDWLQSWASTSERAFFSRSNSDVPAYELFHLDGDDEVAIPPLDWQVLDHVLPPGSACRRDDGTVSLGRYRIRLEVEVGALGSAIPAIIETKPATACTVSLVSFKSGEGFLDLVIDLSRKVSAKGGSWREKPFTLTVSPGRVAIESTFRKSVSLKLCAPSPAAPTVFAVEQTGRGKKAVPVFAVDAAFLVNGESSMLEANAEQLSRDINLSGQAVFVQAVTVGTASAPIWADGKPLREGEDAPGPWLRAYDLGTVTQDTSIEVGGTTFALIVPLSETGQVNPVLAAMLGEAVISADDRLERAMMMDPRGDLEVWLRDKLILDTASDEVRTCLGSSLIEVGRGRGAKSLGWDADLGAFTNVDGVRSMTFPGELVRTAAADRFWAAFEDLELGEIGGMQKVAALPSSLDLRKLARGKVEAYLDAYAALLDEGGDPRSHAWIAYPFSALLFESDSGQAKGALLSPLHPVRLGWCWSVQAAGEALAANEIFGKVSLSFLRFVDGEMFPAVGPATHGNNRWLATGLSAGPAEMFTGWSLLSTVPLETGSQDHSLEILGLELPFGTPSGLDQGGVSSALRDYLRIYPASQQLRIGLAAPRGGKRFAETDDAIIAAAGNLLSQDEDRLPGGIRIVDSSDRRGTPPGPVRVLGSVQATRNESLGQSIPPFEWTTDDSREQRHKVDLQFVEDSVASVRADVIQTDIEATGTSGPALPVNRFRSWKMDRAASDVSSFALGIERGSFGGLPRFAGALEKLERFKLEGAAVRIEAELRMGDRILGDRANWTITGNRNLNPSVLAAQLGKARGEVALWEWRPAFLSRQRQKTAINSVTSTHPYTVLARPSQVLTLEIQRVLGDCGLKNSDADVRNVIANLGIRGVGLSSLLTMGHTQSLGALGFHLAFRGLKDWEASSSDREVRCVVPMDSIFPLLELLGEGARSPDDQRRADLLLLSARYDSAGRCILRMHPVEVKVRSKSSGKFPGRSDVVDPAHQLADTCTVLEKIVENLGGARDEVMVRAAVSSLLEAAFSLRPVDVVSDPTLEANMLGAVSKGTAVIKAERGTLLWFQVGGRTTDGDPFDLRAAEANEPGCVSIDTCTFNDERVEAHVRRSITNVIDGIAADPAGGAGLGTPLTTEAEPTPEAARDTTDQPEAAKDNLAEPVDEESSAGQPGGEERELESIGRDLAGFGAAAPTSSGPEGAVEPAGDEVVEPPQPAPAGIEVLVGHRQIGTVSRPVFLRPSETALNQLNIGVVGDLGTGKTQFLKSLVYQLASSTASNRGVCPKVFLFDYKRDYSEGEFPEALGAQVLDPSKSPLPINFFAIDVGRLDTNLQMERVRRANFFCDLLRRISNIGQVQRNDLYTCVMASYAAVSAGKFPTIDEVFEHYLKLGKSDSVVSVLRMLTDLRVFERDASKTRMFVDLFDRSTVLNLAGLSGAGQDIVDIVATMFLDNLYTDYMKTRPKQPFLTGDDDVSRRQVDSFVLIDEAHHAMGREFDVLMKMMLEGREFGMGVILSSQYLSHFEGRSHDWAEALSTWVVHNIRNATPKQFERIGFRTNLQGMVEQVTKLQTHWAYFRCMNGYEDGILMRGQPYFSLEK